MDTVTAPIGYMSPDGVAPDTNRRDGVLRAPTRPLDEHGYVAPAIHDCVLHELSADDALVPGLYTTGFDTIDLAGMVDLQVMLEDIRQANRIEHDDIRRLRRLLIGRKFELSDGRRLRILFIAGEGTILRKAGPNGLKVNPEEPMTDINGHDGAQAIHGDQDVYGTPIRQILRGLGPHLFRHVSPNGANPGSRLFLLNMWIPLQQITRPLVLMDERTLDRRRHQLRYALQTDAFLDRPADRRLNDIWTFLHDPAQQWYFTAELDSSTAYVFNTLSNPHGACILPGEQHAEQLYLALQRACRAIQQRDGAGLQAVAVPSLPALPADCTAPLRSAIEAMTRLLQDKPQGVDMLWQQLAIAAMDRVVRKSIEMRMVCWVS